jgi:antitoxin component of RelBE/YafQ-DinJ toxin-antitoxin module
MKSYFITLSNETTLFYAKVAKNAGLPVEQVLEDALFKLAGELSLNALHSQRVKDEEKM